MKLDKSTLKEINTAIREAGYNASLEAFGGRVVIIDRFYTLGNANEISETIEVLTVIREAIEDATGEEV